MGRGPVKRFVCSDIIPGCAGVFTGDDDQSVLDQVIEHAAADHGLVKPPMALVELVVATTYSYTAPRKDRHLRLVGATVSNTSSEARFEQPDATTAGVPVGVRYERESAPESVVVQLPSPRADRHEGGAAARSPMQELQEWATHPLYRHECLLYGSDDEFLSGVIPFIRDGLRQGEPVLLAISEPRQGALRAALGDDESLVIFADMAELANPARIIPAVRQFAAANSAGPIRAVGEPVWAGRRAAEITEAQLHESLLDVALAQDTPMWVLCPYNTSNLDAATIEEAHRSHSSIVRAAHSTASTAFGGVSHAASTFGSVLPEPIQPIVPVLFDGTDAAQIATEILHFATARGLSAQRSVKLAAAIDEITTAGARRTGQSSSVRLWQDESAVVCEVTDPGVVIDPLVGRAKVPTTKHHDRDVRLANELCDLVQVRSNASGTTVRVHSWL